MVTQNTWHDKHHATLNFGGRVAEANEWGLGSL